MSENAQGDIHKCLVLAKPKMINLHSQRSDGEIREFGFLKHDSKH